MPYQWSFEPLWSNWYLLLEGIAMTVVLAASAMSLSLVLGATLALAVEFGPRPLRVAAVVYTEIFRSLPLLVLLFWIFLVLPLFLGWALSPFTSGLLALTLNRLRIRLRGFPRRRRLVGGGATPGRISPRYDDLSAHSAGSLAPSVAAVTPHRRKHLGRPLQGQCPSLTDPSARPYVRGPSDRQSVFPLSRGLHSDCAPLLPHLFPAELSGRLSL